MKVLFVSNDPTIFDQASAARERMRTYAAAIGELHIISPAPVMSAMVQDGELFLYPLRLHWFLRVPMLALRAHKIITNHDIEVVSAQDPFEQGLAALWAVRGTKAKLHVQVHTDFLSPWFVYSGNWRALQVRMPILNRVRRCIAGRVLLQAAGIRVVSVRIKESLVRRYGAQLPVPTVIPVMVDAVVPPAVALPPNNFKFTLLAVGRLESEKRIDDIFRALVLVVRDYPMVGLFVSGDGRERARLERLAHRLGIEKHVVFLGHRADARGLMASANMFIQASAYEGYGRTLIEAALAKVPVVTTDVGVVGETFKGYEDMLVVPVADPTALANAIIGLIEDMHIRVELPMRAEAAARIHLMTVGDIARHIAADLAKLI